MKKLLVALFILLLVSASSLAFAKEKSPSPIPTPVDYNLASPGILPDNPLYKLKVLKDKIILLLIQDTTKKAEYHLLLADKEIYASKLLVDKGEISLAKETALKGENEYTLLVFMYKNEKGKPNKDLFEKLELAALKHQEVLSGIAAKVKGNDKKTFETVIEFSIRNAGVLKTIYDNN